ncbi:MAG TPA: hypothetical protein VFI00_00545, partial [Kribbella sp.]|nr:hypothetical protein [Kribbella sp.]
AGAKNFPHFKSFSVTVAGSAAAKAAAPAASAGLPDLLFTWTEVGVGKPDVVYEARSQVTATFGCVNNGSNHPRAGNKTTVRGPVAASATLTADENGKVTGSLVLDTASVAPPGSACPPGQSAVAVSATFEQNTITDTTNGVSATADDITVELGP